MDDGRQVPITQPGGPFRQFSGDRLVKVRLYGGLAKAAGRKVFELAVSSVREAIHALDCLTDRRTTRYITKMGEKVRWRVLVNDYQIEGDSPAVADELMIERNLDTIDIYPVMEGAANWLSLILGVILIVVGIVLVHYGIPLGGFLISAGISAVLGGLISLLQTPSKIPKQKASKGNPSYLFSGTVNTQQQGGPVPVAYGRVIIGSQTISATVQSSEMFATTPGGRPYDQWGDMTGTPIPRPSGMIFGKNGVRPLTVSAITQSWQQLGPTGFWGYINGVSIIPNAIDVPVQQQPLYPYGPHWMIRFDNGSMGSNYYSYGNFGPWESLADAPLELDSIIVTLAAENYAWFAATPNLP
jgi:predicted phage tail protein